jgi:hypothetical protein
MSKENQQKVIEIDEFQLLWNALFDLLLNKKQNDK